MLCVSIYLLFFKYLLNKISTEILSYFQKYKTLKKQSVRAYVDAVALYNNIMTDFGLRGSVKPQTAQILDFFRSDSNAFWLTAHFWPKPVITDSHVHQKGVL